MWKISIVKPNKCLNPLIKADKSVNNISNLNKCVMSPLRWPECVVLVFLSMMAVMLRREHRRISSRHRCGINVWAGWLAGWVCSPPFGPLPFPSTTHVTPPAPSSASWPVFPTGTAELVILPTISLGGGGFRPASVCLLFVFAVSPWKTPPFPSSPPHVRGGSNGSFGSAGSPFWAAEGEEPALLVVSQPDQPARPALWAAVWFRLLVFLPVAALSTDSRWALARLEPLPAARWWKPSCPPVLL